MSVVDVAEASARGDWQTVFDALAPARPGLGTADLLLLSEAAWWLGDSPTSMAASEQAYEQLLAGPGGEAAAAERAVRLALEWFTRGDVQVGAAWISRARRLLDGLPRCVTHGHLRYCEASIDLDLTGDPTPALAAAAELDALAAELDDQALRCFALALRGLGAIRAGDTAAGFAALDEAMLPALAGRLDPLWTGDLYCTVIHLCDDLGDLARMRSWTEALGRWTVPLPRTFIFAGVTRVHELQLAMAEGDWDLVEEELGGRSASLLGAHGWLAGEGYYTLGEVRRLRGDAAGARAAFARARELGREPQPGEALLLHAEGRADEALAQLRIALAEGDRLLRARVLGTAVEVALACHEPEYAAGLARELDETAEWFGTPGLRARADRARAELLLARGEAADAVVLLHRAAAVHRQQRDRHATATAHERLAAAHRASGRPDDARAEEATAAAVYRRLGAAPDLHRVRPRPAPGGLTDREVEVLRVVATGRSNRDVAAELAISSKTVSRHLANIFTKIDVTTRTAASAWAREHGL